MYILIAILLFGVLIAVHEWGHFIAARICGVTVHEFSLGMGPALWSRAGKKGTEFSVRLFPIGGYCAMEGEDEASDDPHALVNQGFWKKVFVFAAGAFMNVVVGFLLILILFLNSEGFRTAEITGFAPEFTLQGEEGLMEGDVLYKINGERVYTFTDINLFLPRGAGEPFDLVVIRDGEKVQLENFPMELKECTDSSNGGKYRGFGIYFGGVQRATFGTKLKMTWYQGVDFIRIVRYSLQELFRGNAGMNDLNGPVGIVATINDVGRESGSFLAAMANIAYFGAMIAMNLAVFNLLPIPALDGGHIFFLIISTVALKIFHKKIPEKYENRINTVFFILLMALMLFVTVNDIWKLLH